MIKATPEKYALLAQAAPGGNRCTSPAIADGLLYLRLTDGVACYGLKEQSGAQDQGCAPEGPEGVCIGCELGFEATLRAQTEP